MTDHDFMRRALFHACRAEGATTPNPMVGAVVVDRGGVVVGQGRHLKAGEAHAEVVALDEAGERARGATLYVTLEPCCHFGRTPPCTRRVIDAGIARVVAAIDDPNPRVSGKGFAELREHGVAVEVGRVGSRGSAPQSGIHYRAALRPADGDRQGGDQPGRPDCRSRGRSNRADFGCRESAEPGTAGRRRCHCRGFGDDSGRRSAAHGSRLDNEAGRWRGWSSIGVCERLRRRACSRRSTRGRS